MSGEVIKRHVSSLVPILSTVLITDKENKEVETEHNDAIVYWISWSIYWLFTEFVCIKIS